MYRRLRNAVVTLLALLAAYHTYTLTVAPRLDPPPLVAAQADADDPWDQVQHAVERYQRLLANYFPPGHWTLTGSPKVLEHTAANALLVYGDLSKDRFGRVDITNTAVVFFPTPRRGMNDAPPDAIVIDAPGVAKLQFDEAFNPTKGTFGWPKRGLFEGEITIRSAMNDPGPEDDLFVRTRDLRLEGLLISSDAEVVGRIGASEASGRVLEIQLLEDPNAAPDGVAAALGVAGVASLEVRHDVRARVEIPASSPASPVVVAAGQGQPIAPVYAERAIRLASAQMAPTTEPVDARCAGSFRFDFTTFTASLQDDVRIVRPRPEGPPDTLVCDELRARFARSDGASISISPIDEPDLARSQTATLGALKIDRVEALGSPAKIESPSVLGGAEGRRIQLWLGTPRLRVEGVPGDRLAMVAYGLNEARAAWIDYEAPPASSGRALGNLSMAGPGWMRVATRAGDPTRLVEARWKGIASSDGRPSEAVRLVRDKGGNPLLIAEGEPEIAAAEVGWLKAARLEASLVELAGDGREGPVVETPLSRGAASQGFLVRTIRAAGGVDFRGAELEGRVDRLRANFQPAPPTADSEPVSGTLALTPATGVSVAPDRVQPSTLNQSAPSRYRVTGEELELSVTLRGRRAEPTEAVCRGEVELRQVLAAAPRRDANGEPEQPFVVRGAALRVEGISEPGVRLTVLGSVAEDSANTADSGRAEVQAKGVHLFARDLHVDQQSGRAWIEGPGDARIRLSQTGATGGLLGSLGPEAKLSWRDGLELLGDRLVARGEVFAETPQQWLHCAELAARFTRPIDLREGVSGRLEVARLDAGGGVSIDHRTIDPQGQTSHQRLQLKTLGADLRSGELGGEGPGWLRSVHLAGAAQQITTGAGVNGIVGGNGGLRMLRVDFRRGLSGNINTRVVRFHERVSALYTPVLAWDDQPPPVSSAGPPPGAVTLACRELRLSEDPASRYAVAPSSAQGTSIGPIEAQATGAVRLEGRPEGADPSNSQAFAAEAVVASYSQAKEVFVLEGDVNRSATIWRQAAPGRQPERVDGRKLLYWPKLDKFKYEDVRGGTIYGAGTQPGAAGLR
ncbi:hypothetical protein [Botrimarina hoheduenensis]|uniref:OstA-like protein n=1 Tax=Botrimarina hoheduenensis TaxID=2528000 RepID=A0A5C5WCF8_9BACT|nr:hypothetical protein [Botrimarina hoheduenensis]TWT47352.1 hypothetical protein Pla111_09650 [Botrimarina hoheduenensis]